MKYMHYSLCTYTPSDNNRTILCLWFRVSLIYIYNCPTRCNTKLSIYNYARSIYRFRVSTTPIIRSTQNCNYSLRYWSYFLCSYLPPKWPGLATLERGSCTKKWPIPEAVITVLCTPDDLGHVGGRQLHKKMTNTGGCNYSFVYSWWSWPRWSEVAAQKIWPVPEAVITVLCTPDDLGHVGGR